MSECVLQVSMLASHVPNKLLFT